MKMIRIVITYDHDDDVSIGNIHANGADVGYEEDGEVGVLAEALEAGAALGDGQGTVEHAELDVVLLERL